MLNMNIKPNSMATIPIMIFTFEKSISNDAIPKNNKLIPINVDTNAVLKIGKIIKINPKIIDNIPDILLISIVFPPNFVMFTLSSEKYKKTKSIMLFII